MHPSRCKGFSYIELLVVVAVVGVLYLLYFGAGSRVSQQKSKVACAQQLSELHLVLSAYAADHNGEFPSVPGASSSDVPLDKLVPQYTANTGIFTCPGSRDSRLPDAEPIAGRRISYAYCMGLTTKAEGNTPLVSDALVNTNPKRAGAVLFSSTSSGPGSNHREFGGNVLYTDGHVETFERRTKDGWLLPAGVNILNPKP